MIAENPFERKPVIQGKNREVHVTVMGRICPLEKNPAESDRNRV
jgi:hypothetical protein